MAIALIHMARGSPWVVLSCEGMTSPSMKRGALLQYVLTTIFAKGGQRLCMFFIAASLFRKLKTLLASTSSTASVWSSTCVSVIACTPASQPLL